ncbi:DUF3080 family protein [Halomonas nitroreducens]|uniref:DUF3080 family protein n=1 Tax=Halomonas nitroreducens TaxID=447425 RepID=A0A3S0JTD3_9GAMM|nr:DUF3080 family protein [Halomonas nitroreducens]RTQ98333.1 DUF3080 family protein [Halomonas nitroreducens]
MAIWNFPISGAEGRRAGWWGTLLLVLLLSGCSDGPAETLLVDYQRRLADALALAPPSPGRPINIAAFPEPEARLFPLGETREGMLAVFALRDCHIANLIAARNNQLGRVAAPSQRWLYELALWRRLSGCWNTEVPQRLGEADRTRLARLTRTKTEQLPRASWNAVFDSSEWVGSFSRASAPLAPDALSAVESQLPALHYLHEAVLHQFDRRWPPDSATLEGHLETLQTRPLTAELLRALLLAERRLEEASALLETALADGTRCTDLTTATGHDRLTRWLDGLQLQSRRWLLGLDRLIEAQLVDPPPAVAAYRQRWLSVEADQAPWPALVAARERHRGLRLAMIRHCG